MTREVSRENSQAAEDKDPKAVRPDKATNAEYGRRFLCHNRGRYYAREILCEGQPAQYVDDRLAQTHSAADLVQRGWAMPELISPDKEPSVD